MKETLQTLEELRHEVYMNRTEWDSDANIAILNPSAVSILAAYDLVIIDIKARLYDDE